MLKQTASGFGYQTGNWPLDSEKPTLVFIHGAGGSSNFFNCQLTGLQEAANTVALDLPAHGQSPGPVCQRIEEFSSRVLAFIQETNLPRPIPVGFSMGGAIVLQMLLDKPNRFQAAVLITTSAKQRVLPAIFDAVREDFPRYLELQGQVAASPKTDPEKIRPVLEDCARQDPLVVVSDFRACDEFDVRLRLHEVKIPILQISAEDDGLIPPKFSDYLEKNLSQVNRVHIQDAGHFVAVEKPGEVNQAIIEFLSRISG